MSRIDDLRRFYELIDFLRMRLDGALTLDMCNGRIGLPMRGVYFFFESTEQRSSSGIGPRVVRVGTHALSSQSKSTLWNRLAQHAGSKRSGAGNHRGSIFRLLVGEAMQGRDVLNGPKSWGQGSHASAAGVRLGQTAHDILAQEAELERAVSRYIGALPFLFVDVPDLPGAESERGVIERNSIALLSNFGREMLDASSDAWLGTWSQRDRVRRSALWNNNHVDEDYHESFFATFERVIAQTQPLPTHAC